jgi:SAM-dependent methyltransferase
MPQQRQAETWNASLYAETARYVAEHGNVILDWLAPQRGERILDLGCGDGALTEKIKQAGATVVGVDGNADMVAAARERGLDARVGVAENLPFDGEFDAVFSNAALHWVLRAEAAVESVRRALRPGGRFVAEFGGRGNVAAIVAALTEVLKARDVDFTAVSPWYFPSDDEYAALLENHGFRVERAELAPRPTKLPADISEWLANFAPSFVSGFSEQARTTALEETRELLKASCLTAGGDWIVDYVRLRVEAVRPQARRR